MNTYTVVFRKRVGGKKAIRMTAAGYRKTREAIEFFDEAGIVFSTLSILTVREVILIGGENGTSCAAASSE